MRIRKYGICLSDCQNIKVFDCLTILIYIRKSIAQALASEFSPLLCGSCIFEPINNVIHIQRFPASSRIEWIQLQHIRLNLLARWMRILLKPSLQFRQFHFRIETRSHSCLLIRILRVHRLQCWMHNEIVMMVLRLIQSSLFMIFNQWIATRVQIAIAKHCEIGCGCSSRLNIGRIRFLPTQKWKQFRCGRIRLRCQLIAPPLVEIAKRFIRYFSRVRKWTLIIRAANLRQRYLIFRIEISG